MSDRPLDEEARTQEESRIEKRQRSAAEEEIRQVIGEQRSAPEDEIRDIEAEENDAEAATEGQRQDGRDEENRQDE